MKKLFAMAVLASSFLSAGAWADHYQAKESKTLVEAVANFKEYNAKMAELIVDGKIPAQNMPKVHELTYTLEVALEKIASDMTELKDTLERVHKASEMMKSDEAVKEAQAYLEVANTVVN